MLEKFLREELAGKYEVIWRYDFRTNSIITEMHDGVLRVTRMNSVDELKNGISHNIDAYMVDVLRSMMHHIDDYREKETKRLKGVRNG